MVGYRILEVMICPFLYNFGLAHDNSFIPKSIEQHTYRFDSAIWISYLVL